MNKLISIYKKYEEIIKYVIVGVLTTVVSLLVYYGLVLTILNPKNAIELQIANIVSWIAAVTFAFFTNRKFVFKSNNKKWSIEAIKFYTSRLFTLFVDMGLMYFLVTLLELNDKISKIIVQFVILVLNYILSKFIVFIKKEQ